MPTVDGREAKDIAGPHVRGVLDNLPIYRQNGPVLLQAMPRLMAVPARRLLPVRRLRQKDEEVALAVESQNMLARLSVHRQS